MTKWITRRGSVHRWGRFHPCKQHRWYRFLRKDRTPGRICRVCGLTQRKAV